MNSFFDSEFWFILQTIILSFVLFGLVFGMIVGVLQVTQYQVCKRYTYMDSQHNYHYDFWTGCVVQLENGRWISVDDYQQLQIEGVK